MVRFTPDCRMRLRTMIRDRYYEVNALSPIVVFAPRVLITQKFKLSFYVSRGHRRRRSERGRSGGGNASRCNVFRSSRYLISYARFRPFPASPCIGIRIYTYNFAVCAMQILRATHANCAKRTGIAAAGRYTNSQDSARY